LRNRIARELHDSVSQNLFGISLNLRSLDYALEQDPVKACQITKLLQEMVEETQTEMRLMIYELRPAAHEEKGFFEASESMINLFRIRYNLDIHSSFTGDEALDSRKQLMLYRILQELLANVAKHAQATKVNVNLYSGQGKVDLLVYDNGKGFQIQEIDENNHFGLKEIKERVAEMGGKLIIESNWGEGTKIKIQVKK
jgi:signal transduction histidine kinase